MRNKKRSVRCSLAVIAVAIVGCVFSKGETPREWGFESSFVAIEEFELNDHYIDLNLKIYGEYRKIKFDTGAEQTTFYSSRSLPSLGKSLSKDYRIRLLGIIYDPEFHVMPDIEFGGITFSGGEHKVAVLGMSDLSEVDNRLGILGANFFFEKFLIIDYEHKLLGAADQAPENMSYWGEPIDFKLSTPEDPTIGSPVVLCSIDGDHVDFTVDTGAGFALGIHEKLYDILTGLGKITHKRNLSKREKGKPEGKHDKSKEGRRALGNVERFGIGNIEERNIYCLSWKISKNALGEDFLSKYLIALDFINNKMYFASRIIYFEKLMIETDIITGQKSEQRMVLAYNENGKIVDRWGDEGMLEENDNWESNDIVRNGITFKNVYDGNIDFSVENNYNKIGDGREKNIFVKRSYQRKRFK